MENVEEEEGRVQGPGGPEEEVGRGRAWAAREEEEQVVEEEGRGRARRGAGLTRPCR